jgi:large subunit ribosomal protein L24e
MPRRIECTFCGEQIEPGTGTMYVRKDGTIYHFCSKKCEKNMLVLKRKPRTTRCTEQYKKEKEQRLKQQ